MTGKQSRPAPTSAGRTAEIRRHVEGLSAIGAARKDTPEFGCAIADAVILAFASGEFAIAAVLADSLLVLPDENAAEWMTFAGVVRFHAIRNMPKDERKTMIKAQCDALPPTKRTRIPKDLLQ